MFKGKKALMRRSLAGVMLFGFVSSFSNVGLAATALKPTAEVSARVLMPPSEPVTLKTATGHIYGTLSLPADTKTAVPVVLLIAGSGPTDRNGNNSQMTNNSLKYLAQGLNENGIAVLRYDKRGVAKSIKAMVQESELRFEHYIQDAVDWAALLAKDKRFNSVNIVGHSEGALLGLVAAQKSPVARYVSLAGAGLPAHLVLDKQLQASPEVYAAAKPILEKLAQGKQEPRPPMLVQGLFRPSIQPYMMSWFKYDPRVEIKKLKQPVLIVQGTTDIQVGLTDAMSLSKARPKAKKVIIPGMNHVLKKAPKAVKANIETYNNPSLPVMPALIKALSQFVNQPLK